MKHNFIRIRYDGPALADHSMDVNHLAPALLALGDLCKLANRKFNRDRASIKVLVNADLEQNCFELSVQIAMDIYEHAKTLIGNDDVASVKEILEWIGLIVIPSEFAAFGLFKALRWLKGRKVSKIELVKVEGKDLIRISVEGDNNNIYVAPQTYEMLQDRKAVKSAKDVVRPVTQEGYERLEFEGIGSVKEEINKEEARDIMQYKHEESDHDNDPQVVTALLQVYGPVYDRSADHWRFNYGENHIYADITETDIAEQAFERGGTSINDLYKVSLEITQTVTETGKITNHYKIIDVLDFKHGHGMEEQKSIDFNGDD